MKEECQLREADGSAGVQNPEVSSALNIVAFYTM